MAVTIGSNIASAKALRQLGQSSQALSSALERLGSGSRINRASDDAAGLAIASSLRSDVRVFTQAARNVNDGVSMLNIAEGALAGLSQIVLRQQELAEQAANGTYSTKQRSALDREFQALHAEYNRIVDAVTFNKMSLLAGGGSFVTLQAGHGINGSLSIDLGSEMSHNAGDGSFAAAASYAGFAAYSVASADFNRDGNADLVFNLAGTVLEVALGNGNGTFKTAVSWASGVKNVDSKITTGDVNGDLIPDIVVPESTAGSFSVLLGVGDGTFKARISTAIAADAVLRLVDINGDETLDVLTTTSTGIAALTGSNDGTFSSTLIDTQTAYGLAAADFNADSIMDFATTDQITGRVYLRFGNGNGSFQSTVTLNSASGIRAISAGDFNADGHADLVVANIGDGLNVFLNNGNGSFQAAVSYGPTNPGFSSQIEVVDFNEDGFDDLAVTAGDTDQIGVLIANSNGTFGAVTAYSVGDNPRSVAAADFNNDGALDIVSSDSTAASFNILFANTRQDSHQESMDVLSRASALTSLEMLSANQAALGREVGMIGALQSRLNVALSSVHSSALNSALAAGRITDADIAQESAELVRRAIMQQAATAVLAQANQAPQLALRLLGG